MVVVVVALGAALAGSVAVAAAGPVADALAQRVTPPWPSLSALVGLVCGHPLRSVVAGSVVAAMTVRWSADPAAGLVVAVASAFAVLAAMVDWRCQRLPDVVVVRLALSSWGGAMAYAVVTGAPWRIVGMVVGAAGAGLVLGAAWLVGMGLGDVKLGMVLAGVVGWIAPSAADALSSSLVSVGLAALIGTTWWVGSALQRSMRNMAVLRWYAFGPFLVASFLVMSFALGAPLPPNAVAVPA